MFCYSCGKEMSDGAVFCHFCGKRNDTMSNGSAEVSMPAMGTPATPEMKHDTPEATPVAASASTPVEPQASNNFSGLPDPQPNQKVNLQPSPAPKPRKSSFPSAGTTTATVAASVDSSTTTANRRVASVNSRSVVSQANTPRQGGNVSQAYNSSYPSPQQYPSYPSSSSGTGISRIVAIIASIVFCIGIFLPMFKVHGYYRSESMTFFKSDETFAILVLICGIVGFVLAIADSLGAKIAFFGISVLCFCESAHYYILLHQAGTRVDSMNWSIGFYLMIAASITMIVCGILMVVQQNKDDVNSAYRSASNRASALHSAAVNMDVSRAQTKSGWRCVCGQINPDYSVKCSCGLKKYEANNRVANSQKRAEEISQSRANKISDQRVELESNKINILKEYKGLLDTGVISQEEFDAKKKSLL